MDIDSPETPGLAGLASPALILHLNSPLASVVLTSLKPPDASSVHNAPCYSGAGAISAGSVPDGSLKGFLSSFSGGNCPFMDPELDLGACHGSRVVRETVLPAVPLS